MSKHIDIEDISRYVSNKMSPEQETILQEHISECEECSKKLKEYRALHYAFIGIEKESPARRILFKIYHNPFVRVAAAIVLVAGIGFAVYTSRPKGTPINMGNDAPVYLSADSLSRDSLPKQDTIQCAPLQSQE